MTTLIRRVKYYWNEYGAPRATYTIIAVCVVSYLLQLLPVLNLTYRGMFNPLAAIYEPWRFVTSIFLHSTSIILPLHLLMNMYTLYMIGPIIERLLGTGKFIAIFMLSGIAGSIGISLWAAISGTFSAYYTSTIGASGAIFGLFGALVVIHKRIGAQMGQLLGVLLINLAFPFFVPGIAWQAHVGGVLTGLLLAYLFVYAAPKMQFGEQSKLDSRKIWVVFTAGVAVLLIVIAFASSQVVLSRLDGLIVF